MAETFQVEAKFDWKTNAPEVLGNLTRGFRELIEQADKLKKAFENFDTSGLRKLTDSLKSLREFTMPTAAIDSLRQTADTMSTIAANAAKATDAAVKLRDTLGDTQRPRASGGGGGSGSRPSELTLGKAFGGATDFYFGSQLAGQAAGALIKPSYDLGKARTQLLANNTSGQADAAIAAAQDLQRSVRGTNVQGNIEVYRQLLALTQNPDEARALMPSFLPAGVALQTFNPDGGDYDHQLEAVTKSAEFRGMLSKFDPKTGKQVIDPSAASHMGDMLLAMNVVSKGAIEPTTFLKFMRSGGTAGANMSMDEIPYLIPILQALGPEKAGTGLKGMEQQFSSGKMSQAAVEMLQEMGILSKDKNLYRKLGMGQFMLKPGAMNEKTFEEAVFHPKEFLDDTLMPKVQAYNHKNYGKKYDNGTPDQKRALDTATLQQLASRIPGGTFMGELVRNEYLSQRDNAAYGKLDPAAIKATMANSPQVAVESFAGSLNNLMGTLGSAPFKDAISALNGLTATLNALSKSAQKNPTAAGNLSTGGVDLTLGAVAGGALEFLGKGVTKFAGGALGSTVGAALRIGGFMASRIAVGFAVDRIMTGAVEALTGQDFAKWIDKHVPGAGWLDRKLSEATHGAIGRDYSKDPIQKESYIGGPGGMQPINITLQLDGHTIAKNTTRHQIRTLRTGTLQGSNNSDYTASPMPAGMRSI